MIHEEQHQSAAGEQKPPSAREIIEQIGNEMQIYALENPTLNHNENSVRVSRGDFSRFLQISNTVLLHVIMSISPADDQNDLPFWHCSMSLISKESGRAKTFQLWTARDKQNIRRLLPQFLGNRGKAETEGYMKTKTALHCHRDLTREELELIGWKSPVTSGGLGL